MEKGGDDLAEYRVNSSVCEKEILKTSTRKHAFIVYHKDTNKRYSFIRGRGTLPEQNARAGFERKVGICLPIVNLY
jgi:hypothetical protein